MIQLFFETIFGSAKQKKTRLKLKKRWSSQIVKTNDF